MHLRPRSHPRRTLALFFPMLAAAVGACTYWYTVDDSHVGPDFELSIEDTEREFTVRACVVGAEAEDMALTVISRVRFEDPAPDAPAEVSLSVAAPGHWNEVSESTVQVAPSGTTSLVEGLRVDLAGLSAVCSDGVLVRFERSDAQLQGRVAVEWTAYASAGSPSAEIGDARLVLESE